MNKSNTAKLFASLTQQLILASQEKYNWLAEERGLAQAELKCLRLFGSDKRMNNKEIARRMKLSESRLTRIIDGLVKKGFMKRGYDRSDMRALSLSLTRKANLFINKLDKENIDIHAKILRDINTSHHKALITAITNLNLVIENWLSENR